MLTTTAANRGLRTQKSTDLSHGTPDTVPLAALLLLANEVRGIVWISLSRVLSVLRVGA